MAYILLLLLILFLGGGVFFFLKSYDEKFIALQKSNLLLKSQLAKIKEKYDLIDSSTKNCNIEFLTVDNHYGLLPENTIIRISPSNNSCIINKINMEMQVSILEKVLIENSTWYYVALPLETNINSKGWVEEYSFSEISNSPIELI